MVIVLICVFKADDFTPHECYMIIDLIYTKSSFKLRNPILATQKNRSINQTAPISSPASVLSIDCTCQWGTATINLPYQPVWQLSLMLSSQPTPDPLQIFQSDSLLVLGKLFKVGCRKPGNLLELSRQMRYAAVVQFI